MFNVKHGDFGIYSDIDQSYICVLDCGTSQPYSSLHTSCLTPKGIISLVTDRISLFLRRDILISHYHEDHFNSLGVLKRYNLPFFEIAYVPYIDFRANYARQFFYSMCLLQATSEVLQIPFTLLKNFSSLFVDKYAQKYVMCHKGHSLPKIKDGTGTVAKVLWPPKNIYNGDSEILKKFITKLENTLHKNNLESAIKRTEKYFSRLQDQMHSFDFSSLSLKGQDSGTEKEIDINEVFGIENSNEKYPDERNELEAAFGELKSAVKDFLNALSIVFRIDSKLVWMGDISDEVLKIIKQDLQGDIEYFKLPHHGTRDVSILNLKASEFVVSISDGRNYKPINEKNLRKAWKDSTLIYCTDGHRSCNQIHLHFYNCLSLEVCPYFYCSRNTVIRLDLR